MPLIGLGTQSITESSKDIIPKAINELGIRHIMISKQNNMGDEKVQEYIENGLYKGCKQAGLKRKDLFLSTEIKGGDILGPRRFLNRLLRGTRQEYVDLLMLNSPQNIELNTLISLQELEKAWDEM